MMLKKEFDFDLLMMMNFHQFWWWDILQHTLYSLFLQMFFFSFLFFFFNFFVCTLMCWLCGMYSKRLVVYLLVASFFDGCFVAVVRCSLTACKLHFFLNFNFLFISQKLCLIIKLINFLFNKRILNCFFFNFFLFLV